MSLLIGLLSILISSKTAQQKPGRSEGEQAPITPEKTFGGVPLSKLSELVKKIYHGLYCSIDQGGFLIFHYKSNRGN